MLGKILNTVILDTFISSIHEEIELLQNNWICIIDLKQQSIILILYF